MYRRANRELHFQLGIHRVWLQPKREMVTGEPTGSRGREPYRHIQSLWLQLINTTSTCRVVQLGMNMDITSKKLLPRLGRRSGQSNSQDEFKSDDDLDSPTSLVSGRSAAGNRPPVAPPRTRKTGWSDDLKSAKMRGNLNIIEQERSRAVDREIEPDDIPVIPDMDEIQEDSIQSNVTINPAHNANRVTAYKELDTDLVKNAAFTSLGDVNLSLLAEKLYNEEMVKESDDVWNWNILFTQVTSEINSEIQKKIPT